MPGSRWSLVRKPKRRRISIYKRPEGRGNKLKNGEIIENQHTNAPDWRQKKLEDAEKQPYKSGLEQTQWETVTLPPSYVGRWRKTQKITHARMIAPPINIAISAFESLPLFSPMPATQHLYGVNPIPFICYLFNYFTFVNILRLLLVFAHISVIIYNHLIFVLAIFKMK